MVLCDELIPTFFTFNLINCADDLIGEAVLPVNDLCSSMSSKRVIQLHRFGQTKTGSITAEVSINIFMWKLIKYFVVY